MTSGCKTFQFVRDQPKLFKIFAIINQTNGEKTSIISLLKTRLYMVYC